jgi:dolichol-phosphate mannosyltransferase
MGLQGVESQGYCFQIDLTLRAVRAGLTVVEVPITFVEREVGVSKMGHDIVREALTSVTRWGVEHRLGQLRSAVGRVRGREPVEERS